MMERAAEIVVEIDGFATDQLNNFDTLDGYRRIGESANRRIGEEIVAQIDGEIHGACVYVGVGGAYIGTVSPIKESWPDLIRTIVEPAESAVIAGGQPGTHRIEGGGIGFIPKLITPDVYDRLDAVSTDDAFATARHVARTEGIWTGPSGGANVLAATRLARELGPGTAW